MRKNITMESSQETQRIFDEAVQFDESLAYRPDQLEALAAKRVPTDSFSFDHLFSNLAAGRPSLYSDYSSRGPNGTYGLSIPKDELISLFRETDYSFKYKIQRELGEPPVEMTIGELIREWDRNERMLRVTNIHLRPTGLLPEEELNAICPFNLLMYGSENLQRLEMMTLMVSTTGSITESHSDDTDVNNHCLTGRKLWLCWDTEEGIRAGLEDCEKTDLTDKPRFDISRFLSLDSSCWSQASEGLTFFLPGNFTHKVITVEKYVGIGGFFVSLPTATSTLHRWTERNPVFQNNTPLFRRRYGDEAGDSTEASLKIVAGEACGALEYSPCATRRVWGYDYR